VLETSRRRATLGAVGALIALLPGATGAVTREIAELQPVRLAFGQSVLNQLTYGTYRDPFDELQTRPHNLLFQNIGRHANLTPWQGQQGSYTRYVNALIGNNGAANVDNDADAIQGSMIRRETAALAWGVSAAFLSGEIGSDDASGASTFSDGDELTGFDLGGGLARQLSERRVLGVGLRVARADSEVTDASFEQGVGGFFAAEEFQQTGLSVDLGLRQFLSPRSSWEAQVVLGLGTAEQDQLSEDLDGTGAVTDRFVITNYDIAERSLGLRAGYNRLRLEGLGEIEFRGGVERLQRELDNSDLAFDETAGGVTPNRTLLAQDPVTATVVHVSAKAVFQAGETEMFSGAELAHDWVDGATTVDAAGTVVNEQIDDSQSRLGLTLGLRQPMFTDKLRFIVSGRADVVSGEETTVFDTASNQDDATSSAAQYAIGLEGVLANVTFDLAWLAGEEAPVVPVPLGLPGGSRRTVDLDRLVFSAAAAW
jgi:hypothetical protein